MIAGLATAAMVAVPRFRVWRTVRTCAFVALGATSLIPILHGVYLYGTQHMLHNSGLQWYLLELALYGGSASLYAVRLSFSHPNLVSVDITDFQTQLAVPTTRAIRARNLRYMGKFASDFPRCYTRRTPCACDSLDASLRVASHDRLLRGSSGWCSEALNVSHQKRPRYVCVVRYVALDLVGNHLLDSLLHAMYDQFISCPYQRAWFPNLPRPPDVAKPCRSVEYSSM